MQFQREREQQRQPRPGFQRWIPGSENRRGEYQSHKRTGNSVRNYGFGGIELFQE
jgi:hypothetical protein